MFSLDILFSAVFRLLFFSIAIKGWPGVHGARLTGAGFGGCAVVLADESADPEAIGGWRLRPGGPVTVVED